jgi:hypothetical protein
MPFSILIIITSISISYQEDSTFFLCLDSNENTTKNELKTIDEYNMDNFSKQLEKGNFITHA